MQIRDFGTTKNGEATKLYTLDNGSMQVDLTDFGATIVAIRVPDKNGKLTDVTLGHDSVTGYEENGGYLGAVIGRSANRIGLGKLFIDGKEYQMTINDNDNNLHNAPNGIDHQVFKAKASGNTKVTFTIFSPHMDQDLPGNMVIAAIYELSAENSIKLTYRALSDEATIANFTNHVYFNLNGHDTGSIEDHTLKLYASGYTPVTDHQAIPTGRVMDVTGTVFDFRIPKRIGQDINADEQQLKYVKGYDHNFSVDGHVGEMRPCALATGDKSGITLQVESDLPGIQLYAGNCIDENMPGKGGAVYGPRCGFCLETQYFPDAINHSGFVKPEVAAGKLVETTTVYSFGLE